MTELSFLIELLLNHDLPKATKDLIAQRIKEVEQNLTSHTVNYKPSAIMIPNPANQAVSTLQAMARHEGNFIVQQPPQQAEAPVPLTGVELQAREKSMEILKGRKHQNLKV